MMRNHFFFTFLSISLVALVCMSANLNILQTGPINQALAREGSKVFAAKCAMCHGLDQKTVGPALRNVTKTRKHDYLVNLITDPAKMQKENPVVKAMMKEYNNLPMIIPGGIKPVEVTQVIEYLRSVAK